jgi:hypothetical protein
MHLRELGIRSAHGYVLAPPLHGSAFLQLIEAIDPLPVAAAASTPLEPPNNRTRKKGGLAAAQLKRHAGGTSQQAGWLRPPSHVTERQIDSPSWAR